LQADRVPTGVGLLGRITVSGSQFANKRGLYAGRRSTSIHVALFRRSRGKIGGHLPGLPAARVLLLTHTGAKSGITRTSPVMYHRDGEAFVVVASKAGQPANPAWFHNLMANPDTRIEVGGEVCRVHARVASEEERARLWPEFVSFFPGYEFYARNANNRAIPIVMLEPR
jgi:deazaflavin-dependent oxidoreductase (nitroreductase family)